MTLFQNPPMEKPWIPSLALQGGDQLLINPHSAHDPATGLPWWHVAAPLVITLVAVLSWSLRPHDRTVTGQAAVASVAGKIAV